MNCKLYGKKIDLVKENRRISSSNGGILDLILYILGVITHTK